MRNATMELLFTQLGHLTLIEWIGVGIGMGIIKSIFGKKEDEEQ